MATKTEQKRNEEIARRIAEFQKKETETSQSAVRSQTESLIRQAQALSSNMPKDPPVRVPHEKIENLLGAEKRGRGRPKKVQTTSQEQTPAPTEAHAEEVPSPIEPPKETHEFTDDIIFPENKGEKFGDSSTRTTTKGQGLHFFAPTENHASVIQDIDTSKLNMKAPQTLKIIREPSDPSFTTLLNVTHPDYNSPVATFYEANGQTHVALSKEFVKQFNNQNPATPIIENAGHGYTYDVETLKLSKNLTIEDLRVSTQTKSFEMLFSALGCRMTTLHSDPQLNQEAYFRNKDKPFSIEVSERFLDRIYGDPKDAVCLFEDKEPTKSALLIAEAHLQRGVYNTENPDKKTQIFTSTIGSGKNQIILTSYPITWTDKKGETHSDYIYTMKEGKNTYIYSHVTTEKSRTSLTAARFMKIRETSLEATEITGQTLKHPVLYLGVTGGSSVNAIEIPLDLSDEVTKNSLLSLKTQLPKEFQIEKRSGKKDTQKLAEGFSLTENEADPSFDVYHFTPRSSTTLYSLGDVAVLSASEKPLAPEKDDDTIDPEPPKKKPYEKPEIDIIDQDPVLDPIDPGPDPTPDHEPTPNPDPQPDPDPEPPEIDIIDPGPSPDPQPDPEPTPGPDPEPTPSPDHEPEPEQNPDSQPEPTPNPDPQPDPEPLPPNTDTDPGVNPPPTEQGPKESGDTAHTEKPDKKPEKPKFKFNLKNLSKTNKGYLIGAFALITVLSCLVPGLSIVSAVLLAAIGIDTFVDLGVISTLLNKGLESIDKLKQPKKVKEKTFVKTLNKTLEKQKSLNKENKKIRAQIEEIQKSNLSPEEKQKKIDKLQKKLDKNEEQIHDLFDDKGAQERRARIEENKALIADIESNKEMSNYEKKREIKRLQKQIDKDNDYLYSRFSVETISAYAKHDPDGAIMFCQTYLAHGKELHEESIENLESIAAHLSQTKENCEAKLSEEKATQTALRLLVDQTSSTELKDSEKEFLASIEHKAESELTEEELEMLKRLKGKFGIGLLSRLSSSFDDCKETIEKQESYIREVEAYIASESGKTNPDGSQTLTDDQLSELYERINTSKETIRSTKATQMQIADDVSKLKDIPLDPEKMTKKDIKSIESLADDAHGFNDFLRQSISDSTKASTTLEEEIKRTESALQENAQKLEDENKFSQTLLEAQEAIRQTANVPDTIKVPEPKIAESELSPFALALDDKPSEENSKKQRKSKSSNHESVKEK